MHMKVEWDWDNLKQSLTALVRRHAILSSFLLLALLPTLQTAKFTLSTALDTGPKCWYRFPKPLRQYQ